MAIGYLDLAKVVRVTMFAFEVQDLQVVALEQVTKLEGVIVEHQYFGQAIVEIPSIGLQTANSLGVVAIGSASFASSSVSSEAIGYFIYYTRVVGNSEAIGIVVCCFAQHCSNWVNFVEDLGNYNFYIDYNMNLNFVRIPKAYLDVGPMVVIKQQRILSHHLHLS